MRTKRIKMLFTLLIMLVCYIPIMAMQGCTKSRNPDIVVTGFAQYDWVKNVLGDNPAGFEIKYLLDNGVDLHNYMPSVSDIASISTSKLFIYTDSDAERWISSAPESPKNQQRKTLNLMSLLSKDERIALDEGSGHVHDESCTHEYDEHIWLSIKLCKKFVLAICDRLSLIDEKNSEAYRANAQSYIESLIELDQRYESTIGAKSSKKLLFADRYPFSYMMRDYEIEVAAAFSSCAADTEISVQRVAELKDFLAKNSLKFVLILENSSDAIAKQIINGTSAQIKTLNSMQSITVSQLSASYLSIMESNLDVLSLVL